MMGPCHRFRMDPPARRAGRLARAARILAAVVLASVLGFIPGCSEEPPQAPEVRPSLDPPPGDPPPEPVPRVHRLMVALEMPQFENPDSLAALLEGFDAFKYAHQGAYEREVAELQAQGKEDFRHFNVFHTAPLYPQWGAFFADIHAFLESVDGWIEGVKYRWYPDESIIDHTRPEVTAGVARIINAWADSTSASHVFLDVTFDHLADWMLRPGDHWPWPREEDAERNERWRENMQWLIDEVAARHPVMINGSVELRAPSVLYESQVWNDERGFSPWEGLISRIVSGEIILGVHAGHHHLERLGPARVMLGEAMVLAAWLLADESYLLIEPEGRPLQWAREIQAQGWQDFVPTGPASEVASGVWRRNGRIGDTPWIVEVDLTRKIGTVTRDSP